MGLRSVPPPLNSNRSLVPFLPGVLEQHSAHAAQELPDVSCLRYVYYEALCPQGRGSASVCGHASSFQPSHKRVKRL